MRFQGFVGTSYTSQSILADNEESINWYRERVESPFGKTDFFLAPTPGFQTYVDQITTTKAQGGRALSFMNNRVLAVIGEGAFEVYPSQYYTHVGDVAVDGNPASIAWNGPLTAGGAVVGNQAMIASGNNLYTYNLTTNTLAFTTTPFQPTQVSQLDGYGIAFDASQSRFYVSKFGDFTSWDPTQFAQRQSAPDMWRAMIVNPPDIWLLGGLSGDVWYDSGGFPMPFAPRTGLNSKFGICAPWSLVAVGYSVIWLSQTPEGRGIVVRTNGYSPQRISTYALETILTDCSRTSTINDAEGSVYQEHGHTFYVLRLPSANATYCYDLESGDWHRRGYWNTALNQWDAWKVRSQAAAFGKHLALNAETNTVMQMSTAYPTELDGSAIRRLRRAPGPFFEHRNLPIRRLEYYLETGTSLGPARVATPPTDTPGYPAYVMHRTSDDGGRTWGPERMASIGGIGQYHQRGVRFHRLGVPYDRVTEFSVSDPLNTWRVISAFINTDAPPGAPGPVG